MSVNFTGNAKIIKRIVNRYNLYSFEVLIRIFTNLVSRSKIKLYIHQQSACAFDMACVSLEYIYSILDADLYTICEEMFTLVGLHRKQKKM